MRTISDSRALLSVFLAAAGCGELAYADFESERGHTQCAIDDACGEETSDCAPPVLQALDDCHWFLPGRGQECLDAMDVRLEAVLDDPTTCGEWEAEDNLPECEMEAVTRRRRSVACFVGRLVGSGRPIRCDGTPVLAPILADVSPRGRDATRLQAVARWHSIARFEHASIAAFARASIELMTLGAPLDLVQRCHQAALDEARHAEAALAIASSLHGGPLRFGALPAVDVSPRSLRAVAIEALIEGCWGEAAAAVVASDGARHAEPAIARALRTIAAEETQHAALGWATVRWAVEQDPALIGALFDALREHATREVDDVVEGASDLRVYGLLGAREAEEIERAVLERLVVPVLRAIARSVGARVGSWTPRVTSVRMST